MNPIRSRHKRNEDRWNRFAMRFYITLCVIASVVWIRVIWSLAVAIGITK